MSGAGRLRYPEGLRSLSRALRYAANVRADDLEEVGFPALGLH